MSRWCADGLRPAGAALIACVIAATPSSGQVLSARVLDEHGLANGRAVVTLLDDSARVVASAQTDSTGVFALGVGRAGMYHLVTFRAGRPPVGGPRFAVDSVPYLERVFQLPADSSRRRDLYTASDVAEPTGLRSTRSPPHYPTAEARSAIGGRVEMLFIVDERGRPESESVYVISSTSKAFTDAVVSAVRRMRYDPARVGKRAVSQLVGLTVAFGCPGDSMSADVVVTSLLPTCR